LSGKAASVLRSKRVDAQTIHSLIYAPIVDARGRVHFRRRATLQTPDNEPVSTIIIDEASMVDEQLFDDLCSFGLPLLAVGDHGQLAPVGRDFGLMKTPDFRLEDVHRQAQDNPILRLATAFREGRPVPYWTDPRGRLNIAPKRQFDDYVCDGTQLICGFNPRRHCLNARVRGVLGFHGPLPHEGERLICLRNNRIYGLFNGQQVWCEAVHHVGAASIALDVRTEDENVITVRCHRDQFGRDTIHDHRDPNIALLDFGYCLTAHKSQGSEWDRVVVFEEIASGWDPRRWRYTVATRAKKSLVYCC
jgi:exodeoxyribonuclease-5